MTKANKNLFVRAFHNIQISAGEIAHSKGWAKCTVENTPTNVALCHSELSELLEGARHGNPPDDKIPTFSSAEAEAADTVIRLMHMAHDMKWRFAEAIIAKLEFNQTREHKHGGKKF